MNFQSLPESMASGDRPMSSMQSMLQNFSKVPLIDDSYKEEKDDDEVRISQESV